MNAKKLISELPEEEISPTVITENHGFEGQLKIDFLIAFF